MGDSQSVVRVRGLRKVFTVSQRGEGGFLATVRGFVRRRTTEVTAVDGIDLDIPAGEIRALIGPNGAGKSTTIKVLSGILHPNEGEVRCLGMTPWHNRTAYVRRIGAVFGQKTQLQWDLPAIDTFILNRSFYSIPKATYDYNLQYFTKTFDLEPLLSQPVRTLSLGERMKCELTAALLHDPELVFLDEPTIGLDLLAKDTVRQFVRAVNADRGTTFLLTTHDLDDIENLCRRITIINHGMVIFDDTLDALRRGHAGRRVLQLRFRRPVTATDLADWTVERHDGLSATLSLSERDTGDDYPALVARVLAALPVQDIEIRSPDIESIIREAYQPR